MFRRERKSYDEPALYDYAVGALSRKMRSVAELKRLLRQRVTANTAAGPLIDAVIARLKDHQYLNDTKFAAAYSSYRKANEKFGKLRVVTDLKAKGVHAAVIEKAIDAVYGEVNEEKLAREHLARKRLRKPANQKDAARVFRALARAGFSSRTIFSILKKWDVAVDEDLASAFEAAPE